MGNQQQRNSDAETGVGNSNDGNSNAETYLGIPQDTDSYAKIGFGNPENTDSYHKIGLGNKVTRDSHAETVLGNPQVTDSQPKTGVGIPTVTKPLPETWAIDEVSIKKVSARLKKAGFSNVKKTGKRNIAKVLLHFHNKGKGGFKELHKVTWLSEGGVGKLMMSLQKRGTIHRTTYQHYALSAGALQVLQLAYNDVSFSFGSKG